MKNQDKFEKACREYGMVPVYRVKSPESILLVADSVTPIEVPDENTGEIIRRYVTMWALGRDQLEFGHRVYMHPTPENADQQHRINHAIRDAYSFCESARESGMYHA